MLPWRLLDQAQNKAHTIYCPHGHALTWRETEADRLRRERDLLKQRQAMLEDEARAARAEASAATARATKAEAAERKLKKRAAAGTCPCCQRTFANMASHMKSQHPDFVADTGAKVVPIAARPRG
jgi:septal ring factor EnvC (AmiA/AmiB activator)